MTDLASEIANLHLVAKTLRFDVSLNRSRFEFFAGVNPFLKSLLGNLRSIDTNA